MTSKNVWNINLFDPDRHRHQYVMRLHNTVLTKKFLPCGGDMLFVLNKSYLEIFPKVNYPVFRFLVIWSRENKINSESKWSSQSKWKACQ
jgi:hypothetical protein